MQEGGMVTFGFIIKSSEFQFKNRSAETFTNTITVLEWPIWINSKSTLTDQYVNKVRQAMYPKFSKDYCYTQHLMALETSSHSCFKHTLSVLESTAFKLLTAWHLVIVRLLHDLNNRFIMNTVLFEFVPTLLLKTTGTQGLILYSTVQL